MALQDHGTRTYAVKKDAVKKDAVKKDDPVGPRRQSPVPCGAGRGHGGGAAARAYLCESLDLLTEGADRHQHAEALNNLGWLAYTGPSPHEAAPFFVQAHALWTDLDDTRGRSAALIGLGCLAVLQGDTARGRHRLGESEALARQSGDPYTIAHAAYNLGWACLASGDRGHVARYYGESLEQFEALHDARGLVMSLEGTAATVAHRCPAEAARLLAAASGERLAARTPQPESDRARYARYIQQARDRLGAQAWEQATRAGETLSLDDAVREARALLDEE